MQQLPFILFDRARFRKRRARAASGFAAHDFLNREAAARAVESLSYILRPFPTIIELSAQTDMLGQHLRHRPGTTQYLACDLTTEALAPQPDPRIVADEELLPFATQSADAVISLLSLQWVNDLPGTLAQIHRILKPDGLFLAILPGGETLRELRSVFADTETVLSGGVSPRVAPFIDVRDAGALLQRAGFALPVADSELLTVTYPNLFALMNELRGAGQVNMLREQLQHFTPRGFFLEAAKRYAETYNDAEKQLITTVEFVTMTGWKPAANQQQPAKRGSGTRSLRDVLN